MVRGKSRRGYIPRTIPDRERLKRRADKIAEDIKKIPGNYSREQMVGAINRINSQIRGIIQYYQCCTWVNIAMQKHSRKLQLAARRRLKQYNGKWIPANQTRNLPRVHQQYKALQRLPSADGKELHLKTKLRHHTPTLGGSCILNVRKRRKCRRVWMKCIRIGRHGQSAMANGGSSTISSLL